MIGMKSLAKQQQGGCSGLPETRIRQRAAARPSSRRQGQRRRPVHPAAQSAAAPPAAAPPAPPPAYARLPRELRDATAVLAAPGGATAYVLGVSHVSAAALGQIRALIEAVRPEAVLLELCKDRTGLLAWHAAQVRLPGLPEGEGWPTVEELVALLNCRGSSPVSASQLEDDAVTLLSTGEGDGITCLFRAVRLAVRPPTEAACAPAFAARGGGARLQPVAPLGAVEFSVEGGLLVDPAAAAAAADAAVAAANAGAPALAALLRARRALLGLLPEGARGAAEVVFSGAEAGRVASVLRPVPAGARRGLSGLEGSAEGGRGWGVEQYKRQARQAVSSGGLQIELGPGAAAAAAPRARGQAGAGGLALRAEALRQWSGAELAAAEESSGGGGGGGDGGGKDNPLAAMLTQTYARFQAQAGRRVGVAPGAAWRAALAAAAAAGAPRVYLGDRPADTTAARLAAAVWESSRLQLLGSILAALASAAIVWEGMEPAAGGGAAAAAAAAAAALPLAVGAWPVAAPLLEVAQFAGKSAAEIEGLVAVKEPLQAPGAGPYKLWGEDALLSWPGAMEPVIHERDAYMARALLAAAEGGPPEGLTPAYVATHAADGEDVVYHYAQPAGGLPAACPPGTGAGAYAVAPAPRPAAVVAVVGTAHVRGICAEWARAAAAGAGGASLAPYL
eukprot:scaffold5.g855.t1